MRCKGIRFPSGLKNMAATCVAAMDFDLVAGLSLNWGHHEGDIVLCCAEKGARYEDSL